MNNVLRPAADWELAFLIREAVAKGWPLDIIAAGSKRLLGRPTQTENQILLRSLVGVTLYEPNELVMSVRAATPVADVEARLAEYGQMLAFEPLDVGPLLGGEPGQATIGGTVATNLAGARRIYSGGVRDLLLGVKAVTGSGDPITAGGRVMKNVTGLDITRTIAGSWGTLAAMTEVTFKVQPIPETTATLAIFGLPDEIGIEVLCTAMGTPYEITGAIHLQQEPASRLWHSGVRSAGQSATLMRLENFSHVVASRIEKLKTLLKPYGEIYVIDAESSRDFWHEMRQLTVFHGSSLPLWRISTAPTKGPKVVAAIASYMPVQAIYDWSGGLVWLEVPQSAEAGATDIRRVIALHGGHATLIRAEPAVRAAVEVFQPLDPGVEVLTRRIKATFDPNNILNPGRMYAGL